MPLQIVIPEQDFYDARLNRFVTIKYTKMELEHSLISISKWEAKWHKPYMSRAPKTSEEDLDYIRCMCITKNVDPNVFAAIDRKTKQRIMAYIVDSQTGTTFPNQQKRPSRETMTNEVIYFWMTYYNIPFDPCAKWHLNHLLTLIEVCGIKNQAANSKSKRPMSREALSQRAALNAQRRARYNTRG